MHVNAQTARTPCVQPRIWKFMIAAIPALFAAGIILGLLLSATFATTAIDGIGWIVYATMKLFAFGVVPAVILGAAWYSCYRRFHRMPLLLYLAAGPAIGITFALVGYGPAFEIGVAASVFLVMLHVLLRLFPGLVE